MAAKPATRAVAPPRRSRLFSLLKPIGGLALLAWLITWIVREGELLSRLNGGVIVYSTLASACTIGLNALTLRLMADFYRGRVTYPNALRLSALGALGNALGGLPIGTTLKFILLYKGSGLTLSEITAGLVAFSLSITLWLLAVATVAGHLLSLPLQVAGAAPLVLLGMVVLAMPAARWARRNHKLGPLIDPLLQTGNVARILALGAAVAALFLANYWLISSFLFPHIDALTLLFAASIGILVSLGSLLQSVGGIHELAMGFSSYLSGQAALTGIELGLVMRLTSILASAALFAVLLLHKTRSTE